MHASPDLDLDCATATPAQLVEHLERRIQEILADVEGSTVWRAVTSGEQKLDYVVELLKELYLEIHLYQPESVEAALASIAQMPRTIPVAYFDEMLHHQVEEFDHGEMALRDYLALGGNEQYARTRMQSPSAFAVAAVWRNIAHKREPFAYLGAIYLFEALTPIVTAKAKAALATAMGKAPGLEFITHHATADVEHERQMKDLILSIATLHPEKIEAIAYGFEYFAFVYPMPVWNAAMNRVDKRRANTSLRQAAE